MTGFIIGLLIGCCLGVHFACHEYEEKITKQHSIYIDDHEYKSYRIDK